MTKILRIWGRGRAASSVRHADQQCDGDPGGHHRRAARGQERGRQAGQWNDARDAAEHHEQLNGQREAQAGRQELAEAVAHRQRRAQASLDEDQVQDQDGGHAGQAQLLREGGQDEVRVRQRHELRVAPAPTGAHEAAGGLAKQALDELVRPAVVHVGIQGVEPDVEARLHVAERIHGDRDGRHEERETDDQPRHAVRRHVQHRNEQAEEEQRSTQVTLQDEDRDADQPHDHDRAEVAGARQAHAQELAAADRQVVAVSHEVSGEEDRQRDLHELTGLDGDGTQVDPDARTEGLLAQAGNHRQEQEEQRQRAEGVGVAAQHAVVAQGDQDDGGDDDRDAHEERLPEADHGLVPARVGQV